MKPASNTLPVLATIGAAALFATSATSRAVSGVQADSVAVAAARLFIGALGLVAISAIAGRYANLRALWRQPLVWLMGLGVAAYQALFFVGTGLTGVAIGTLASLALGPLFAGLLAWGMGGKAPSAVWWASTAVAIAGLVTLSAGSLGDGADINLLGVLAAVGAGLAYAVYTVLGTRLAGSWQATDVLAASFLVGAALLVPLAAGKLAPLATPAGIGLALWLGLVATTLAYIGFGMGIARLTAGTVATLNLAEPVIATILGVFVVGESLVGTALVGSGLIALALGVLAVQTVRGKA